MFCYGRRREREIGEGSFRQIKLRSLPGDGQSDARGWVTLLLLPGGGGGGLGTERRNDDTHTCLSLLHINSKPKTHSFPFFPRSLKKEYKVTVGTEDSPVLDPLRHLPTLTLPVRNSWMGRDSLGYSSRSNRGKMSILLTPSPRSVKRPQGVDFSPS